MNHNAVCRTAPATPGLLNINTRKVRNKRSIRDDLGLKIVKSKQGRRGECMIMKWSKRILKRKLSRVALENKGHGDHDENEELRKIEGHGDHANDEMG